MFAPIRFVMTGIGLALIGIAVAILAFSTTLERLAGRQLAERVRATSGVNVMLDAIRISPLQASLRLEGVKVENPEEWGKGTALELSAVRIRPDWKTLFSQTPTIREIRLEGAEAHLDYGLRRGTNIGAIIRAAAGAQPSESPVPQEETNPKRVRLERLVVDGGTVKLAKVPMPIKVEPFELDMSGEGEALTGRRIAAVILRSLMTQVLTVNGLLNPVRNALVNDLEASV